MIVATTMGHQHATTSRSLCLILELWILLVGSAIAFVPPQTTTVGFSPIVAKNNPGRLFPKESYSYYPPTSISTRRHNALNDLSGGDGQRRRRKNPLALPLRRRLSPIRCWIRRCSSSMRRSLRLRVAAITFALCLAFSTLRAPPASASSSSTAAAAPAPPAIERVIANTPEVDTIIDRYVEEHMFDDDMVDDSNFGSAVREAYEDVMTGEYPSALREIMGRGEQRKLLSNTRERDGFQYVIRLVRFMEFRLGFTETAAMWVIAGFITLVIPFSVLVMGTSLSNRSKRKMNEMFKERYGDSYSVDATLKPEEPIEAPDDDYDDDDDEDDEDSDDEDDDDDE